MKFKKATRIKTFKETTAMELDNCVNGFLAELDAKYARYEILESADLMTVRVKYEWTEKIPETLTEEYEVRGELCKCAECVYLVTNCPGNVKYPRCEKGTKTNGSCWCCDDFYKYIETYRVSASKEAI